MNLIVKNTNKLQGQALPPSSKSQTIRGIILALLANGESILENFLESEDTLDALRICNDLGAEVTIYNNKRVIQSAGLPIQAVSTQINSGNSGITTRFVLPILGLRKNSTERVILNCGEQMRARPIKPLVDALRNLGLSIEYLEKEGELPVAVTGNLLGGEVEIEGLTSQYISALLISLPCALNDSKVSVKNLHERPYMEMTLNCLWQQNIILTHEKTDNYDIFHIKGNQRYKRFQAGIAGDFSSASYLIAASALTQGSVEIQGMDMNDSQGDKRLIPILQEMGADIDIMPDRILVRGGQKLTGIKIDANDIPDLVPTLAVIGTHAYGKTEICNVRQARIKETDRLHSMTTGLLRLGAKIDEYPDGMTVHQSKLCGNQVDGYGDHRTVMALSIAGLLAEGSTMITDSEAINKTFPTFVEIMQSLGAKMEVQNG